MKKCKMAYYIVNDNIIVIRRSTCAKYLGVNEGTLTAYVNNNKLIAGKTVIPMNAETLIDYLENNPNVAILSKKDIE